MSTETGSSEPLGLVGQDMGVCGGAHYRTVDTLVNCSCWWGACYTRGEILVRCGGVLVISGVRYWCVVVGYSLYQG